MKSFYWIINILNKVTYKKAQKNDMSYSKEGWILTNSYKCGVSYKVIVPILKKVKIDIDAINCILLAMHITLVLINFVCVSQRS